MGVFGVCKLVNTQTPQSRNLWQFKDKPLSGSYMQGFKNTLCDMPICGDF